MKTKLKKDNHFTCKNCRKIGSMKFANNIFICTGIIKKPKISHDIYRLCFSKYKQIYDLMKEEILAIINLLSDSLIDQEFKHKIYPTKPKK